ncbi:hypothetical protein NQZ68_009316 [Dissostichus eleginoides]|nr:hypothetical protein NQZ68_009316 [Dissostichus eleginoides]
MASKQLNEWLEVGKALTDDQDFTIIPGKQTVLVTINGLLPPEDDVAEFVAIPSTESFGSLPEDLCLVEPFKCPACTPDMLAIAVDGNRKHYRFKKSRGTDEPSLFDGLFIAQDSKVSAFVDKIRSQMTSLAEKSSAKVDEEGLQIAVCRHGILLQGLNHYRGGIYAYPMFLQKELAEVVLALFGEEEPLTEMKPFLSVMHAKAHTGKCEVQYANMITVLAMQWNHRKVENLHKTLAKRFIKTTHRAQTEVDNLESLKQELNISLEDTEQWVLEVKQWKHGAQSSQEEVQREIDEMIYSLRRKKHDPYRQNDSNQTRQRKWRRLTELKKKLRERILQYNTIDACTEKIDTEAACSLSEDVILPWDAQGDDIP